MTTENLKSSNQQLFMTGMILSMFCWGISWASGKVLSGYGEALNITFYRFIVTFVSIYLILLATRQKLTIQGKGLPDLLLASVLIALYTWLFFKGLFLGKAGAGGVLVTTLNPLISYSVLLLMKRRRPSPAEMLGLFIGLLAGVILLKLWDNWQSIWSEGNSYFVLATITWTFLSMVTARSSKYGSPVTFSLWMYGVCTLLMFAIADFDKSLVVWQKADSYFWGNLLFSSTITTGLATTFYFVATSRLGAGKASSFIFLVPFTAALGGWLFLKEVPEIHTIIGGLLGVGAVYILNKK